uniref:RNA-binding protein KhpA n=1 Tax=candidate division WWE3 bacterium TaxID=2053526 RepID=A0A7C4TPY7_UNCKA
MQEFLTYLLTNIVKNPQDVKVAEVVEGNTFVYNISVSPDDMGLVIGKEGRTIKSVRALAKAKAIKEGVMIKVELLEPDGSKRMRPEPEAEVMPESGSDE